MNSDLEIIAGCIKGKRIAQEALFNKYAPSMRYVCVRYASSSLEVDDIFQDAFIKVFQHIKAFRNESNLEAWIKRIFINTAINYYNKNKSRAEQKFFDSRIEEIESNNEDIDDFEQAAQALSKEELISIINQLPEGYRVVFNLYAIEEYKHKEIAEILQISEGTSKSQLYKARSMLKKFVKEAILQNNKVINIQFENNKIQVVQQHPKPKEMF
ncbi:MAG: RNA polymerase sigma factor [Cytophagales bacterium]|nr:MAG: RNA polymerase sigma factor [Cytophagales bacterium]